MWEVEELRMRVTELEDNLKEERDALKPILDFWNASKLVGRLLVILGGVLIGAVTVIPAVFEWLTRHWK